MVLVVSLLMYVLIPLILGIICYHVSKSRLLFGVLGTLVASLLALLMFKSVELFYYPLISTVLFFAYHFVIKSKTCKSNSV
ncbi:hypothetical protein DZB91_18905 [Brevibacillus sp. VP]|nr:hypothetical protein DZB91_18905 [Brevibacillus sp. VP]